VAAAVTKDFWSESNTNLVAALRSTERLAIASVEEKVA
jgi:hypothetical protein